MQLSYEALQIYIEPVQILQYTLRLVTNVHWHCICIVAQQILSICSTNIYCVMWRKVIE